MAHLYCIYDSEFRKLFDQDIRLCVVDICQDARDIPECFLELIAKTAALNHYLQQDGRFKYFSEFQHEVLLLQRFRVHKSDKATEPTLKVDYHLLFVLCL